MPVVPKPGGPIPVLETEHLTLRGHRLEDLDACFALWSDPQVVRFIGGKPSSREEAWARLLRYAGHWALLGYGFWAVCEKGTGRFAGELGIADFKRDIDVPLNAPEAGWVIAPWAQGRGFATEALLAAHQWFEGRFGKTRTACLIDPDNRASLRVAAKCGYREMLRTDYKGERAVILERVP